MNRFVGSATKAGMTESMMYWTPAGWMLKQEKYLRVSGLMWYWVDSQ